MCESLHGESQCNGGCALHAGQLPSLGDGKEVAEAYRELEENVRFKRACCKQGGHGGVGIQRMPHSSFLLVGRSALKGWTPQRD